MQDRPDYGDRIEMPIMGDDVRIEVGYVPDEQLLEGFGILVIYDLNGDEHLVEKDCDTWVTVNPWLLMDKARDIYRTKILDGGMGGGPRI